MSQPERIEPDPIDGATDSGARADWLVGAEEGIEAEIARRERLSRMMPAPKLMRPGVDTSNDPSSHAVPPRTPLPMTPPPSAHEPPAGSRAFPAPESSEGDGFSRGPAMVWEPAPSSVPSIRRDTPMRSAPANTPSSAREFPMDDAEERARVRAEAREFAARSAEQSVRPHTIVAPDSFDLETVAMPWWMQLPAQLKTDRRLQLLLGGVALVLVVAAFWPRGPQPESLHNLNRYPDRFDGHIVTVAGRVGDVFDVGGGHAYYLLQDHDTLVVFTRGVAPDRRKKVTLSGTVSTGYLDGQPHLALFEMAKN